MAAISSETLLVPFSEVGCRIAGTAFLGLTIRLLRYDKVAPGELLHILVDIQRSIDRAAKKMSEKARSWRRDKLVEELDTALKLRCPALNKQNRHSTIGGLMVAASVWKRLSGDLAERVAGRLKEIRRRRSRGRNLAS
jgi:hypothetical protein